MIDKERARELLKRFPSRRVVVLGDLMLDRYVTGTVTRISPEAPVPVVLVKGERAVPGGAANVALNVRMLGGAAGVVGVLGADAAAGELDGILKRRGIGMAGVVRRRGMRTTVKTRVVAERQQVVRVDCEDPPDAIRAAVPELVRKLTVQLRGAAGLIVEDYGKGVVCQAVVDAALAAAASCGVPVGLDPKNMDLSFAGLTLATPNYKEACEAVGMVPSDVEADLGPGGRMPELARRVTRRWGTELLLVTLGPQGMYIAPRGKKPVQIPTLAREVFDVSGAGDTVIAAAMLALAAGATHYEAASLANHAAGVVVGKLGTATCSPAELLGSFD